MTAKTNAEKQSARRERLSCGGLFKRRDFWCHPSDEQALRALERKLQDRRKMAINESLITPVEPSEFQRRVLDYVAKAPNQMASARKIAAFAFPERWENRSGRGALAGHVARAGHALIAMGLITCILSPKDRWGSPKLCGQGK